MNNYLLFAGPGGFDRLDKFTQPPLTAMFQLNKFHFKFLTLAQRTTARGTWIGCSYRGTSISTPKHSSFLIVIVVRARHPAAERFRITPRAPPHENDAVYSTWTRSYLRRFMEVASLSEGPTLRDAWCACDEMRTPESPLPYGNRA